MDSSVVATATTLAALSPGERAWFWFSPDLSLDAPRLLLSSLRDDPGMRQIRQDARHLALSPGGRLTLGMASVGPEGLLELGAPGLTAASLAALAAWVKHHAEAHPALGRLKDCRMLAIRADGVVEAVYEDAALWAGLTAPPAPGTLSTESAALDALPVGQRAWFWMSTDGPRLLISPLSDDADGSRFRARLQVARQGNGGGASLGGVLKRVAAGLVLTTAEPIDAGPQIVSALLGAGHARALEGARLLQMASGRFVGGLTVGQRAGGGPDLSRQVAVLEALAGGERGLFWFTDAAADGAPLLLLETDKDALRDAAHRAGGRGRTLRGRVGASKAGWLEFRAQKPYTGFITALAGWAAGHLLRAPGLSALRGARMTIRDGDGTIIDRQRDDAAWDRLGHHTPE